MAPSPNVFLRLATENGTFELGCDSIFIDSIRFSIELTAEEEDEDDAGLLSPTTAGAAVDGGGGAVLFETESRFIIGAEGGGGGAAGAFFAIEGGEAGNRNDLLAS